MMEGRGVAQREHGGVAQREHGVWHRWSVGVAQREWYAHIIFW